MNNWKPTSHAVQTGRDYVTGEYSEASIDSAGLVGSREYVWDTSTLAWVKMQQPVINTDTVNAAKKVIEGIKEESAKMV